MHRSIESSILTSPFKKIRPILKNSSFDFHGEKREEEDKKGNEKRHLLERKRPPPVLSAIQFWRDLGRGRGRESGLEPRQSRSGTRVKGGKFKERTARALPTTLAPTHHRLSSYIDGRALRNASTGLELARASFTKCRVYRRIFREFRALISGFSIRDETRRDAMRRGEARRGERVPRLAVALEFTTRKLCTDRFPELG